MVETFSVLDAPVTLKSDLASEFPLYLYVLEGSKAVLYSDSISDLLSDLRIRKPLKICSEGVSFLLQSGVVPPPKTVFEGVYVIGIGDEAHLSARSNQVDVFFSHNYPFLNRYRPPVGSMDPDFDTVLEMLATATSSRLDHGRDSYLFHSAGKDSNTIALALAEAGWQDKVSLITHKSKGSSDESELSARIAKRLGFKHKVLKEVEVLSHSGQQEATSYFKDTLLPCTDTVSMAYPLYLQQLPGLRGSNIIDGGGNDSYMMIPPTKKEKFFLSFSKLMQYGASARGQLRSESVAMPLTRTPAEWCGANGFSYSDSKKIFPSSVDVLDYWRGASRVKSELDDVDFKTSVLAPVVASELHIRKVRIFAEAVGSRLVLPFSNEKCARYFSKMPESYLFDKKSSRNKLILRDLLKDRLSLDSDKIGKMGFSYDSRSFVINNWEWMQSHIYACDVWDKAGVDEVIPRLRISMYGKGWSAGAAGRLLYRIFLLSIFFNTR
ncbi:asparagine synthase (glutamine-hydrolysing) [Onishia taeanensis]|uniref:Asparagine synthase (Glutamine-hydrolysing) n=1 Tax=Onishia taeanensis TaxID=284577 RepID=A0A328XNF7_9GAMM|nr:hypothetical protein [Halomonas taeanensis]RAR56804.1 asparagine synthase (glutamine-hydrolysing) [Halomonas taeanensis]